MSENGDKNNLTILYVISILSILILFLNQTAFAYTQDQLEWKDVTSKKLRIGEHIKGEGYEIKVVDLPPPIRGRVPIGGGDIVPETPVDPFVMLDIYKDNILVESLILRKGESSIIKDDIRVIIEDLPGPNATEWIYEYYKPWVSLKLQRVYTPEFDIKFIMKKSYVRYTERHAEFSIDVKNEGTDATDVVVLIDTDGLKLTKNEQEENIGDIQRDNNITITYGVDIPETYQQMKIHNISIVVNGKDIRDRIVSGTKIGRIIIGSEIAPEDAIIFTKSTKDRVYLGDSFVVSLDIVHKGGYSINPIVIDDYVTNNFEIIEDVNSLNGTNGSLRWNANIDNTWSNYYVLRPKKVGRFELPSARLDINLYGVPYSLSSSTPEINVIGPNVIATKMARLENNTIRVYITVQNRGTGGTVVSIKDSIPSNFVLLRGNTELNKSSIDKGRAKSIVYEIGRADNSTIVLPLDLPSAIVRYSMIDNQMTTMSNNATVVEITPVPTPTEAPIETPVETPIKVPIKKEVKNDNILIYTISIIGTILSVLIIYAIKRRKSRYIKKGITK